MLNGIFSLNKWRYAILLILLVQFITTQACDICGCFMGITPYDNQSQISFLHRYRVFNGYRSYNQRPNVFTPGAYKMTHESHVTNPVDSSKTYSSHDYESYKTFELRLKFFIHKRIELNAILPYGVNKSKEDTEVNKTSGLNDPTFFVGYHLIQKVSELNFQQRLIIGTGIKFPIGNCQAKSNDGDRIPVLMQAGTGSFDYFFYTNYVMGFKKFGININAMYKFNGSNSYKEKIDNSSSCYLNLFYKIKIKNILLIPAIQTYYEYTEGLRVNGELQNNTTMNCMLVGPGIDLNYKNFGINLSYQLKALEKTSENNLQNAGRILAGVNYGFNQNKYLFHKKAN